jgi:hypothetical protein
LHEFKPTVIFIECDRQTLLHSLTNFHSTKILTEIDVSIEYSRISKTLLIPVDRDQSSTRKRLTKNALYHPLESLKLQKFQRRHNLTRDNITSLEEALSIRQNFIEEFPTLSEIIYTERERFMGNLMKLYIDDLKEHRRPIMGDHKFLFIHGASHVFDEVHDLEAEEIKRLAKTPLSAIPLIFMCYVVFPLLFLSPWQYYVIKKLKQSNS